jgi:hypothetical protein
MIELRDNKLTFRFLDVHSEAQCHIDFQRTLRIPDDNREYPLPPGLGRFPIEHVGDYSDKLPGTWRKHGGVFVPMYQAEALWINFSGGYPCAVKIAAGKINAVSGESWRGGLSDSPQDYVVIPDQPWLDGFNVAKGYIRQFVAMPLGAGFSAEEQITGEAEHGGLQLVAYPMKRERYEELVKQREQVEDDFDEDVVFCCLETPAPDMGLAPGGLMRQEIYEDDYGLDAWNLDQGFRYFVHLANSEQYGAITGHAPPHKPPTASDYTDAGLRRFDYYADKPSLSGSDVLKTLRNVAAKTIEGGTTLTDNEPVTPKIVKTLGAGVVRDGEF